MITKTDLKPHESKIEKYFDHILESQSQGEDVKGLISILSQRQRNHFAMWLDDPQGCRYHHSKIDAVKEILFSL